MVLKQEAALEGLTTVDIAELQTRCQELVDEAVSGRDPLVITRDGRPLACLSRHVGPARPFYVRPSSECDGAVERVYREVVETLHRNVTVAELQNQSPELVEQAAASDWTVLVWNRTGHDATLTRYFWSGQHRNSGIDSGDLASALRELRDETAAEWERSLDRKFPL